MIVIIIKQIKKEKKLLQKMETDKKSVKELQKKFKD